MAIEQTTLGGGCFWCLEAVYDQMKGVSDVESGYAGGHVANPTYEQVCAKTTGHAEVVRITYDTDVISLADLLDVFFTIHDPTQLNRQGNDIGPQYRSAIFTHNDEQARVAREKIAELEAEGLYDKPFVTEITPLDTYYVAEDYHQEYFQNHPYQGYCVAVVRPKVAKFRKMHMDKLREPA